MGAAEAAVRVQAVVKGSAVNTQNVGLQVALLRGTVRAVPALERLPSWEGGEKKKSEKTNLVWVTAWWMLAVVIVVFKRN